MASEEKKVLGRPSVYKSDILPRMADIWSWKAQGLTDKDIADRLGISARTFTRNKKEHEELAQALTPAPLTEEEIVHRIARSQVNHNKTFHSAMSFIRKHASDEERLKLFETLLEHSTLSHFPVYHERIESVEARKKFAEAEVKELGESHE